MKFKTVYLTLFVSLFVGSSLSYGEGEVSAEDKLLNDQDREAMRSQVGGLDLEGAAKACQASPPIIEMILEEESRMGTYQLLNDEQAELRAQVYASIIQSLSTRAGEAHHGTVIQCTGKKCAERDPTKGRTPVKEDNYSFHTQDIVTGGFGCPSGLYCVPEAIESETKFTLKRYSKDGVSSEADGVDTKKMKQILYNLEHGLTGDNAIISYEKPFDDKLNTLEESISVEGVFPDFSQVQAPEGFQEIGPATLTKIRELEFLNSGILAYFSVFKDGDLSDISDLCNLRSVYIDIAGQAHAESVATEINRLANLGIEPESEEAKQSVQGMKDFYATDRGARARLAQVVSLCPGLQTRLVVGKKEFEMTNAQSPGDMFVDPDTYEESCKKHIFDNILIKRNLSRVQTVSQ